MRLDKYLKVSRLIKRRTVANEVADAGRILINGKTAKASQAVKAGDIIEVTFGNRPIKVKVLSDVEPRTKDVAREMYEIIEQDNVLAAAHDAPKAEQIRHAPAPPCIRWQKRGGECHETTGRKAGAGSAS